MLGTGCVPLLAATNPVPASRARTAKIFFMTQLPFRRPTDRHACGLGGRGRERGSLKPSAVTSGEYREEEDGCKKCRDLSFRARSVSEGSCSTLPHSNLATGSVVDKLRGRQSLFSPPRKRQWSAPVLPRVR